MVFLYITRLVPKEKYYIRVRILRLGLVMLAFSLAAGLVWKSNFRGFLAGVSDDEFLSLLLSDQGSLVYCYLGGILIFALLYTSILCRVTEGSLRAK